MNSENVNDYAKVALKAYCLIVNDNEKPRDAWNISLKAVFPDSKSSQDKSCPRSAFLGLCQEGLLVDIPSGNYTRSVKNKGYAIEALKVLQQKPKIKDSSILWTLVNNNKITHNSQMNVVLILVDNDLINWKNIK